jgi:hypothetical protein
MSDDKVDFTLLYKYLEAKFEGVDEQFKRINDKSEELCTTIEGLVVDIKNVDMLAKSIDEKTSVWQYIQKNPRTSISVAILLACGILAIIGLFGAEFIIQEALK